MTKTYQPSFAALQSMQSRGGSFARGLAQLYLLADSANREKLVAAFGDLFGSYES